MQIFISYARKDDRTLSPGQTGWVKHFDMALEAELEGRGLQVNLWRDKRDIDKNDFWDDVVQDGLDESKILIAVMSPNYIQRDYCLRELDEFIRSVESRGVPCGAELVYKVLIRPLPPEKHPAPIRRKEGFSFFTIDREKRQEKLYYVGYGTIVRPEYWDVLLELGQSLEKRIRDVPADETKGRQEPKGIVYLAETSNDRAVNYRRLRRELNKLGYKVVPTEPLPTMAGEAARVVRDSMAQAALSVHLLGATAGFAPEGTTEKPIVPLQLECAAERADDESGFRRLIWLPHDLRCENERQRELLDNLTSGKELLNNDELVRDPFPQFVEVVLDSLPRDSERSELGGSPSVFIMCEKSNEERGLDLLQVLADGGCEAILPFFAGSDEEQQTEEQKALSECDGVILIYSDERREPWIRQQLDRLEKLRELNRDRDFAVKAVCLAGPATPRKERFRTLKADCIICRFDGPAGGGSQVGTEGLRHFLQQLKPRG